MQDEVIDDCYTRVVCLWLMHNWTRASFLCVVGTRCVAAYIHKNGQDVVQCIIYIFYTFVFHFTWCIQWICNNGNWSGMNQLLWYYADLEKKACQVNLLEFIPPLFHLYLILFKGKPFCINVYMYTLYFVLCH